jgi:Putative heavy-metal chelation
MGRILEGALERIPRVAIRSRRIARFRLHPIFTVVELDDRSTGAAMNYARITPAEREQIRLKFQNSLARDPLLLETTLQTTASGDSLVELSLRAAIASALVVPEIRAALRAGGDASFRAARQAPFSFFEGVTHAVVIGFGGYMNMLARRPELRELHIVDLGYAERREEMDKAAANYRQARPDLTFTVSSDASKLQRPLRHADVLCITGSALCNRTLEGLLDSAAGCKRIIVQGQSAGIHPEELFLRGVAAVVTTTKPANLIDLADLELLDSVLETDASAVYLWPRSDSGQNEPKPV